MFIGLTGSYQARVRRKVAVAAIATSFFVFGFFIALGQIIVEAGVWLRDFQIAGGLILLLFAANMAIGEGQETPEASSNPTRMLAADRQLALLNFGATADDCDTRRRPHYYSCHAAGRRSDARMIGRHGANVLKRIMGMVVAADRARWDLRLAASARLAVSDRGVRGANVRPPSIELLGDEVSKRRSVHRTYKTIS